MCSHCRTLGSGLNEQEEDSEYNILVRYKAFESDWKYNLVCRMMESPVAWRTAVEFPEMVMGFKKKADCARLIIV